MSMAQNVGLTWRRHVYTWNKCLACLYLSADCNGNKRVCTLWHDEKISTIAVCRRVNTQNFQIEKQKAFTIRTDHSNLAPYTNSFIHCNNTYKKKMLSSCTEMVTGLQRNKPTRSSDRSNSSAPLPETTQKRSESQGSSGIPQLRTHTWYLKLPLCHE